MNCRRCGNHQYNTQDAYCSNCMIMEQLKHCPWCLSELNACSEWNYRAALEKEMANREQEDRKMLALKLITQADYQRQQERKRLFQEVALVAMQKCRQGEALELDFLIKQTEAILQASEEFAQNITYDEKNKF